MRRVRLLALCALLLAGPGGCIATLFTDPMGYHAAFDDTQRQYTNYLRWGQIEKASGIVDPALREAFLKQASAFEGLRITDYERGEVAYLGNRATVTVTYAGYALDTFIERKIREDQQWYREDGSARWRVRSDVAVFARASEGAQR
jgi:hypothetical protein